MQASILFGIIGGLLVVGLFVVLWPWTRRADRLLLAGAGTAVTFVAWRLVLGGANATGLDVDAPVIRASWEDVGSGILAFVANCLALGLVTDRAAPAARIVGVASAAGLLIAIYDIFVP